MSEIFNTGDGRKLALFESRNFIFMCAISREYSGRPVAISNDFAGGLCACTLGNKLYYAYAAADRHVKVKAIDSSRILWEFNTDSQSKDLETSDPNGSNPGSRNSAVQNAEIKIPENIFICSNNGLLLLFYTVEAEENSKTKDIPNGGDISHRGKKLRIYSHVLIGEASASESALLMQIYGSDTFMPRIYTDYCIKVHIDHELTETLLKTKKEYLFSISEELEKKYAEKEKSLNASCGEKISAKERELKKSCQEQMTAKENEMKKKYQEQISAKESEMKRSCQEQMTSTENALRGKYEKQMADRENMLKRNYESRIKELNATISSIKLQYEQLMNTASRYRDEAAKWHSMYHSKFKKAQSENAQ